MSDHASAATNDPGAHDAGGHDAGGHDAGGHGHEADSLGPIDWAMWAAGAVGVIAALVVTAGLVAATGFAFNA